MGGVVRWFDFLPVFLLAARLAFGASPLLAGWVGMIGLVLGLHFGVFHLLSLVF